MIVNALRLAAAIFLFTMIAVTPSWEAGVVTAQPSPASDTVDVYAQPQLGVGAPVNFEAVYVTDRQVDLTWTKGTGSTNTMIRADYGVGPADETDGRQVYFSTGESFSDVDVDLRFSDTTVIYRAWGEASTVYSSSYDEAQVGGNQVTYLVFFIGCSLLSLVAVRSGYPLIKYGVGVAWLFLFLFTVDNPPAPLTAGEAAHTVLLLLLITLTLAFPLSQLWRDVRRGKDASGQFTITEERGFQFKMPKIFQNPTPSYEQRRQMQNERVEAYRAKIHAKLNPPGSDRPSRRRR